MLLCVCRAPSTDANGDHNCERQLDQHFFSQQSACKSASMQATCRALVHTHTRASVIQLGFIFEVVKM